MPIIYNAIKYKNNYTEINTSNAIPVLIKCMADITVNLRKLNPVHIITMHLKFTLFHDVSLCIIMLKISLMNKVATAMIWFIK